MIEQVAATVPCDARMLSNARTAGAWEATTGRRAVTEGHAVFLRPEVMERILPVLIGANEFFSDPAANRSFLDEQRIEYLVVVKPGVWVGTTGPREPQKGDADAIAALAGRGAGRSGSTGLNLLSVRHPSRQPRRCPVTSTRATWPSLCTSVLTRGLTACGTALSPASGDGVLDDVCKRRHVADLADAPPKRMLLSSRDCRSHHMRGKRECRNEGSFECGY